MNTLYRRHWAKLVLLLASCVSTGLVPRLLNTEHRLLTGLALAVVASLLLAQAGLVAQRYERAMRKTRYVLAFKFMAMTCAGMAAHRHGSLNTLGDATDVVGRIYLAITRKETDFVGGIKHRLAIHILPIAADLVAVVLLRLFGQRRFSQHQSMLTFMVRLTKLLTRVIMNCYRVAWADYLALFMLTLIIYPSIGASVHLDPLRALYAVEAFGMMTLLSVFLHEASAPFLDRVQNLQRPWVVTTGISNSVE